MSNLSFWRQCKIETNEIIHRATIVILYKSTNGLFLVQLRHMIFKWRYLQGDASLIRYSTLTSNLSIRLSYEIDFAGITSRATRVILYKSSNGSYLLTLGHMDYKWRYLQGDASISRYSMVPQNLVVW